jgi:hypothetical protein
LYGCGKSRPRQILRDIKEIDSLMKLVLFLLTVPALAQAEIVFQTGFESPAYQLGSIVGQNAWMAANSSIDSVENTLVESGTQALELNAALATGQDGVFHAASYDTSTPNAAQIVDMMAFIYLSSSSTQTAWQFASLTSTASFIGGFNILANGELQLVTTGIPVIAADFPRDVWTSVETQLDFQDQTFTVLIDGDVVSGASNVPFATATSENAYFLFDTFGNGNDQGYLDNLTIQTVIPEPATWLLLLTALALTGACAHRLRAC